MVFCEAKKVFRSITNLPLCHVCWKIDFKEGNDVRAQLRTAGPSEPDGTGDNPPLPRNNLAEEAKPIPSKSNELLLLLAPPLRFVRPSYGPSILA